MHLSQLEADAIDASVVRVERRTGVQVVTAVVGRSDPYAEVPWKAFALGAAVGALGTVATDLAHPVWATWNTAVYTAIATLAAGAASAIAATMATPYARLFLWRSRVDTEVRQAAESLFLRRELFATRRRQSVLIFLSLFERRIEVLSDVGLKGRVSPGDWQSLVAAMGPSIRHHSAGHAIEEALASIESLLVERGFSGGSDGQDELPNRPIEEDAQ